VPAVLAQVGRDPGDQAGPLREEGRLDRIGVRGAPRLPDGRDVIDVQEEAGHGAGARAASG
jgi:hypothetical protein